MTPEEAYYDGIINMAQWFVRDRDNGLLEAFKELSLDKDKLRKAQAKTGYLDHLMLPLLNNYHKDIQP